MVRKLEKLGDEAYGEGRGRNIIPVNFRYSEPTINQLKELIAETDRVRKDKEE